MSKIVDRIRKLFRLAQSDNPSEAANALAHAQRLMQSHRIKQTQLDEPDLEEMRMWVDQPLAAAPGIAAWKQAIAGVLAEVNDCLCLVSERHVLHGREKILVIAGRRSDFEVCVAMYGWIVTTIERLAKQAGAAAAALDAGVGGRTFTSRGMGRAWLNSFRLGAAAEVEGRLRREQRKQRIRLAADPKTSTALDVRRDAVKTWAADNLKVRPGRARTDASDPMAYAQGARAGRVMPLREHGGE